MPKKTKAKGISTWRQRKAAKEYREKAIQRQEVHAVPNKEVTNSASASGRNFKIYFTLQFLILIFSFLSKIRMNLKK